MSMTIAVAARVTRCSYVHRAFTSQYKGLSLSLSVENIASFLETRSENKYVIYRASPRFTAFVGRYSLSVCC